MPQRGIFCTHKPNSVRTNLDDHIPGLTVASELMRLSEHFMVTVTCRHKVLGTALHASKDLAVSPYILLYTLFHEGIHCLSAPTSLLAPLVLRPTGVTRYPAPPNCGGRVRTFLPALLGRAIIVSAHYAILIIEEQVFFWQPYNLVAKLD